VEEFVHDGGIGIVASHLDSELRDLATEIVTMGEPE